MTNSKQEIIIPSLTPYFLERADFWFEKNLEKIKKASQNQIWWKENVLILEKDLAIDLFALMRQITELGYEKAQTIGAPGEFSQRGGILDIFPLGSQKAYRLEFAGKKIGEIQTLEIEVLKSEKKIKKELSGRKPENLILGLKPGNYLTHLDHGIGIFLGFTNSPGGEISTAPPDQNSNAKLFVLRYSQGDRLFVPLELEEKLSRYIGFEKPIIHRLSGSLWFNTKKKAKENTIKLAKELLEIYAHRAKARGFQYPSGEAFEKELEADFPYIETDDQIKAINDVKKDMESARPMDRLICGDVGFGKTEVALRAAFKAVLGGKQVAVLAPTTILANQHFRSFCERLKKFPVRLAILSRLQNKTEQTQIIKETATGKIDILIGTHRILSRDVDFKNLGLAIIDEEQRFGVKQKERFKEWRAAPSSSYSVIPDSSPSVIPAKAGIQTPKLIWIPGQARDDTGNGEATENIAIDILSMSATPIPRTMNLALAGLRDISVISTPPPGRLNIKTFVEPFREDLIKEAIEKELNRGGQVYFLYNKVETIASAAKELKQILSSPPRPRGRVREGVINSESKLPHLNPPLIKGRRETVIAAIHGRMHEKNLIRIINNFRDKKIDILVATTIIENGLDFPNANTLIVANAARLGLAQAYQIRGRIGRSHIQAHAYFLYQPHHLTEEAQKRLDALKEAEALGSGYQIAMKDLEIRGAGNVLGREQSGPINAVGLNLYLQMLSETIEEMKESI